MYCAAHEGKSNFLESATVPLSIFRNVFSGECNCATLEFQSYFLESATVSISIFRAFFLDSASVSLSIFRDFPQRVPLCHYQFTGMFFMGSATAMPLSNFRTIFLMFLEIDTGPLSIFRYVFLWSTYAPQQHAMILIFNYKHA